MCKVFEQQDSCPNWRKTPEVNSGDRDLLGYYTFGVEAANDAENAHQVTAYGKDLYLLTNLTEIGSTVYCYSLPAPRSWPACARNQLITRGTRLICYVLVARPAASYTACSEARRRRSPRCTAMIVNSRLYVFRCQRRRRGGSAPAGAFSINNDGLPPYNMVSISAVQHESYGKSSISLRGQVVTSPVAGRYYGTLAMTRQW